MRRRSFVHSFLISALSVSGSSQLYCPWFDPTVMFGDVWSFSACPRGFISYQTVPLCDSSLLRGRQDASTMQGSAGIQTRTRDGHGRDICATREIKVAARGQTAHKQLGFGATGRHDNNMQLLTSWKWRGGGTDREADSLFKESFNRIELNII